MTQVCSSPTPFSNALPRPPFPPQTIDALRGVCRNRVVLTGTPMQNDLDELWAMCDFASPGTLPPLAQFRTTFAGPIDAAQRPVSSLKKTVFSSSSSSSYPTTHTTKAEPRAQEQPWRRRRRPVARRSKDASKEKTRPPPVLGGTRNSHPTTHNNRPFFWCPVPPCLRSHSSAPPSPGRLTQRSGR